MIKVRSYIEIYSVENEWIDVAFIVEKQDEERARAILEKAYDEFWENEELAQQCYGDVLEAAMDEAGITYEVMYLDNREDEENE